MQCINRSMLVSALFSIVFCSNILVSRGQPYEKPNYEAKILNEEEMKAMKRQIAALKKAQEKMLGDQRKTDEEEKDVILPLSEAERDRKNLQKIKKGAATGTIAGSGIWGLAHAGVGLNNLVIHSIAIAKGTTAAGGALMAAPGLVPLAGLVAAGGALGAFYGWATGD